MAYKIPIITRQVIFTAPAELSVFDKTRVEVEGRVTELAST